MPGTLSSRRRATLCVVAVAASCAAVLPGTARADDAVATPGITPPELAPPADIAVDVDDVVSEVIEEASDALETTAAGPGAAEASAEDDEPEQEASPAEQPVTAESAEDEAAENEVDGASTKASTPDTTADSGDTATDSSVPAESDADEAPAAPVAAPTKAGPTPAAINLNVSVRIGSTGDNGAVTQLNAAATPDDGNRSTAAPATPAAVTSTLSSPTMAPTAPASSSEWYWQWNCEDLPSTPVVSPTSSMTGSVPTSWTWIWNCGGNSDQYQGETEDQYQQINTNVSIRISSPGNDGPVTQTNLAISTGIAVPISLPQLPRAPTTVALPAISVPMPSIGISLPSIGISLPSIVVGHPAATPQGSPSLIPLVDIGWEENVAGVAIAIDTLVPGEIVSGEPVPATPVGPVPGEASPAASPETPRGGPGRSAASETPAQSGPFGPPGPVAALGAVVSASNPASHEAGARSKPRPSPRWTPSEGPSPRAPATAPTGASAASAAGGGGSSGGLPIFLALPFVAVLLDLARRVALERATWPSGHRRRVPDTPG
jgi:hypothetical protein